MPDSDREVFDHFNRDAGAGTTVRSLAYAAFAAAKFDWMAKFEAKFGVAPQQQEIDRWISEIPDSRLDELKETALRVLEDTNEAYFADAWAEAYVHGKDDELIRRVTAATAFWRNLPVNLAVGIASSFAFALLLILASVVFNKDPSPIALYQKLAAPSAATLAK